MGSPLQHTLSEFQEVLSYDPETGLFTWKVNRRGRQLAGKVAGSSGTDGYSHIVVFGRFIKSHRLAWLFVHGRWPNGHIDHINGIPSDNRICNLREASQSQNMMNTNIYKRNRSGIRGVSWCNRTQRWVAQLGCNGKSIFLGRYNDKQDAAKAYEVAARDVYGEFCRVAK